MQRSGRLRRLGHGKVKQSLDCAHSCDELAGGLFSANIVFITLELVFGTIEWTFTAMDKLVPAYEAFLFTRTHHTSLGVSLSGKIETRSSDLQKVGPCHGLQFSQRRHTTTNIKICKRHRLHFLFSQWNYMCSRLYNTDILTWK